MRVGIVGLGLIGASIGLALQRRREIHEVLGHDGHAKHASEAQSLGSVDRVVPLEIIASCDLVFVAVPPSAILPVLMFLEKNRSDATFVTDCASVKVPFARWAKARKRKYWFVPGHPMGGTEHSGPSHADATMFDGKPWILTPPKGGGKTVYAAIEEAVSGLGAKPIRFDAAEHDAQIALISHLPHLIAAGLIAERDGPGAKLPHGGSWSDMTRVGGSNPELWADIMLSNRKDVVKALSALISSLGDARTALRRKNEPWLHTFFARAEQIKRKRGDS